MIFSCKKIIFLKIFHRFEKVPTSIFREWTSNRFTLRESRKMFTPSNDCSTERRLSLHHQWEVSQWREANEVNKRKPAGHRMLFTSKRFLVEQRSLGFLPELRNRLSEAVGAPLSLRLFNTNNIFIHSLLHIEFCLSGRISTFWSCNCLSRNIASSNFLIGQPLCNPFSFVSIVLHWMWSPIRSLRIVGVLNVEEVDR